MKTFIILCIASMMAFSVAVGQTTVAIGNSEVTITNDVAVMTITTTPKNALWQLIQSQVKADLVKQVGGQTIECLSRTYIISYDAVDKNYILSFNGNENRFPRLVSAKSELKKLIEISLSQQTP